MARNAWFEAQAVRRMRAGKLLSGAPTVFAYSYAALEIFREARRAGCRTVLGQIDPAIAEEDIVADAVARHAELNPHWQRAPASYWQRWREECALADRIVVNSEWAREGLIELGIEAGKLHVVPLAYEGPRQETAREWPAHFDAGRPLRLLFLGSVIVRKGAAELLAAARLMRDEPVEFHLVGPLGIDIPEADRANPRLFVHGPVSRQSAAAWFRAADVFILPTLSDGFGLTLIEAQAHGLPVIASRHCGDVVRDDESGFVLDEVSGEAIASAVRTAMSGDLRRMSEAAVRRSGDFSAASVVDQLVAAAE